ncbi:hypothetical protein [Streptomyces chartreusis]
MNQVVAEPYEEDEDWDGEVEEEPKSRAGAKPLVLTAAAREFEQAQRAYDKLKGKADTVDARLEKARARYDAVQEEAKTVGPALEEATQRLTAAREAYETAHAELTGE